MMPHKAKRIIIVTFDGLRPDLITERTMPNLFKHGATEATWFKNSRSVFPTVTRVASSSFATGSYPCQHGIVNNEFNVNKVDGTEGFELFQTHSLDWLDAAPKYLRAPLLTSASLGECLAANGKSYYTVHGGSSGAAYLANNEALRNGHWTYTLHGAENSLTPEAVNDVTKLFGNIPSEPAPKTNNVERLTDIFIEHVLKTVNPDVALLWLTEPDSSFHTYGLGSAESEQALKACDNQFARILEWIENDESKDETLLFVLSDHGHLSVDKHLDLSSLLAEVGVNASTIDAPDVDVVFTQGRSGELRLTDSGKPKAQVIVNKLNETPEIEYVFSNSLTDVEGAFELEDSFSEHSRSADLFYVCSSSDETNKYGVPGVGATTCNALAGSGQHGGLSTYEVNSVLMLSGMNVMKGTEILTPSGLIDVAPTVLSLLGIKGLEGSNGRVLEEAFDDGFQHLGKQTPVVSKELKGLKRSMTIDWMDDTPYLGLR